MDADDGSTKGNDAMVDNRGIDAMVLVGIEKAIPPDDRINNEQDKTIRLLTLAISDRRSGLEIRGDDNLVGSDIGSHIGSDIKATEGTSEHRSVR